MFVITTGTEYAYNIKGLWYLTTDINEAYIFNDYKKAINILHNKRCLPKSINAKIIEIKTEKVELNISPEPVYVHDMEKDIITFDIDINNTNLSEIIYIITNKNEIYERLVTKLSYYDKQLGDFYHFILIEKPSSKKWLKMFKILIHIIKVRANIKYKMYVLNKIKKGSYCTEEEYYNSTYNPRTKLYDELKNL